MTLRRPSPSPRVCADGGRSYGDVITKLSWLDGIPIFPTNDASLARIARLSYAFIPNMGGFNCAPSDFVVLYNYTLRDFPRRNFMKSEVN